MGREHDVGTVGESVDGLGEVTRPGVRVADQGAAQGEQVVQIVGGVLGHAQCAETREIEMHLGGRLGARRHLELDLDSVDGVRLAGVGDVDGRDDDGDLAGGWGLAKPATDLPLRSPFQQGAVHVGGPPGHRRSGVDVLLHGMRGEALRRQHRDLAGVDVGLRWSRPARRRSGRRGCGCRSPRRRGDRRRGGRGKGPAPPRRPRWRPVGR